MSSPTATRAHVLRRASVLVSIAVCLTPRATGATPSPQATHVQPERSGGWVVLSLDEYRRLREKAYPPDEPPAPPPVDVVLTRVDYDLRAQGGSAVGEARLTLEVLKDGWAAVSVPQGLRVSTARLDGRPVALVPEAASRAAQGGAGWQIWLSRRGPATLTLDVVLPVTTTAGVERLELPPAPAAIARAALAMARNDVDVSVTGGLLTATTPAAGGTRYVAHARAGETLALSWRRRKEDVRPRLPLRWRGSVTQFVGLGEDALQVQAVVALSVTQGQADGVTIALPDGFAVNEVAGALLGDWTVKPGALDVTFAEPVETSAELTLQGELRAAGQGALDVPLLRLPGAERETGGLALEVLGAGEITADTPRALDRADAGDLGPPVAGREAPTLLAFRYRPQAGSAPRALRVDVARYTPQEVLVGNVEEARHLALLALDGKRLVQASYAVRSRGRSFLAVALPPGATLWAASVDGRPVRPGVAPAGALLVPLPRGRAGSDARATAVQVSYVERAAAWGREGRATLALSAVDLPVSRTGLELYTPPGFRLQPQSTALAASAYVPPLSPALTARPERPASPQAPAEAKGKADKREADAQLAAAFLALRREGRGTRVAGVVPVEVTFPRLGQLTFLAGEVTAADAAPTLQIAYERVSK